MDRLNNSSQTPRDVEAIYMAYELRRSGLLRALTDG
jgi:hypothetical protein